MACKNVEKFSFTGEDVQIKKDTVFHLDIGRERAHTLAGVQGFHDRNHQKYLSLLAFQKAIWKYYLKALNCSFSLI